MLNRAHPHLLPAALSAQSKIGVVSLASVAEAEAVRTGCERLADVTGCVLDPPVQLEPSAGFAGSMEARREALCNLWQRADIAAIVCTRGGYGSNYLCPWLCEDAQQQMLRTRPKAFVGYSDNTSILLALDRAGIACFHGPMVASDFACGRADVPSFRAALSAEPLDFDFTGNTDVRALISGDAEGAITGGCLSVVVTSLGTPWEIESEGRILFLEDVNERPYRIDRMLMQLLAAGKLRGVRGFLFGAIKNCQAAAGEEPLDELICRILGPLGVPVAIGFPSGHVDRGNLTLPFGVSARLHASGAAVRVQVEPATKLSLL